MPKWISAAFALFLSLQVFSTKGETVDDVINNYVKAMGGRDRLISIKTVYAEAVMTEGRDKLISVKRSKKQNELTGKNTFVVPDDRLVIFADSVNWNNGGATPPNRATELSMKSQPELAYASSLVDYSSKGNVAELTGKQNVQGTACFAVKLTLKTGVVINYFIDAEKWYIIREIRVGNQPGNIANPNPDKIIDYSNYQKTNDGYTFPFRVLTGDYSTRVFNYKKIEVNKPVNSGLYNAGY